jgi:hypothetical protein
MPFNANPTANIFGFGGLAHSEIAFRNGPQ